MDEPAAVIRIEDISKTYHPGEIEVRALSGVSLTIDRGDFLVVTGRNGSGKSTLMHQLGLLDTPDSGRIFLDGREVTTMSEGERTGLRLRDIGYIFQEFALIADLTALENVMLPAMMVSSTAGAREKARALLSSVGMDRQQSQLPGQLSGGEQQKVAIARALVNDPAVVLADEPTARLDSIVAADVLSILKRLNAEEGHTIVMVTHESEETRCGNRLITLADGRLVNEE